MQFSFSSLQSCGSASLDAGNSAMAAAFSFLAKEFLGAEHQICVGFPVCPWVLWKIPGLAENSDFLVYKLCLAMWSYFMAFCPQDSISNPWSSAYDATAKYKKRALLVWVLKEIFSKESWNVRHKVLWSMVNLAFLVWDWKFILYRFFCKGNSDSGCASFCFLSHYLFILICPFLRELKINLECYLWKVMYYIYIKKNFIVFKVKRKKTQAKNFSQYLATIIQVLLANC